MALKYQSETDVLVAGGGPAGILAALSAARNGAKTCLVERGPFLGGNAVIGLPLQAFYNNRGDQIVGGMPWELVSSLLDAGEAAVDRNAGLEGELGEGGKEYISKSIPVRPEPFKIFAQRILREAGVEILYQSVVVDTLVIDHRVAGLVIANKEGLTMIPAKRVIDCTGDGDVAALSGAPYEKGRSKDGLMQPMSQLFVLGGVDLDRAEKHGVVSRRNMEILMPDSWKSFYKKMDVNLDPWIDELEQAFPNSGIAKGFQIRDWGDGVSYAGNMLHIPYYDGSTAEGLSKALQHGKDLISRLVEFLKQNAKGFEDSYLIHLYPIGIRETRRIMGDYVLTYEDVIDAVRHEDDVVLNGYFVDIHDYHGTWLHLPERTQVKDFGAYGVPYRCLLPRETENLLIAGRCLSATHESMGSARVMGTCMGMGQAAGTAAALSIEKEVSPRELDRGLLRRTLVDQGAIVE